MHLPFDLSLGCCMMNVNRVDENVFVGEE